MPDNALYFPYINVPNSDWFMRVLLYWDKACSIVPYEYFNHPERLAPHMRDLVVAELVEQIIPGQFIYEIPNFVDPFMDYVHGKLATRKKFAFAITPTRQQPRALLHIEKINRIDDELIKLGLAQRDNYPWVKVDAWVADAFMAYLAMSLGKLKEVNASPVTGESDSFQLLIGKRSRSSQVSSFDQRRAQAREIILERILPCPVETDINKLIIFKSKHRNLLFRLRNTIERKCIDLANIDDNDARQEYADSLIEEVNDQVNQIVDAMKSNWTHITFGTLIPILGAGAGIIASEPVDQHIAGVVAGASLATAVYQAFEEARRNRELLRHPLAYAAFARSTFQ